MSTTKKSLISIIAIFLLFVLIRPNIAFAGGWGPLPTPAPGMIDEVMSLFNEGEAFRSENDYESALDRYLEALRIARAQGNLRAEADVLMRVAWCNRYLQRHEEAILARQEELDIRRRLGDRQGEATAILELGNLYYIIGDVERSTEFVETAIPIFEDVGDRSGLYKAQFRLLGNYIDQNWYHKIIELADVAAPLAHELQEFETEELYRYWQGYSNQFFGYYEEAVEAYELAIEVAQTLERGSAANYLMDQAECYLLLGETASAIDNWEKAILVRIEQEAYDLLDEDIGFIVPYLYHMSDFDSLIRLIEPYLQVDARYQDPETRTLCLFDIGLVYFETGQYDEALSAMQSAVDHARANNLPRSEGFSLQSLSIMYLMLGENNEAFELGERALILLDEFGYYGIMADLSLALARGYMEIGEYDNARILIQEALDLYLEAGDAEGEVDAMLLQSYLHFSLRFYDRAMNALDQALTRSREIGYALGEARALAGKANLQATVQGDFEAAQETHEQLLEIAVQRDNRELILATLNALGFSSYLMDEYQESMDYFLLALELTDEDDPAASRISPLVGLGITLSHGGYLEEGLIAFEEALDISRVHEMRHTEAEILYQIGYAYDLWDQDQDALSRYLDSIDLYETIRGNVEIEAFRMGIASRSADIYQLAAQIQIQLGEYEEAFTLSEQGRARALLDQMHGYRPALFDEEDTDLLEREQELASAITALENELLNFSSAQADDERDITLERIQNELSQRQQEYVLLLEEMQLQNPQLASLSSISTLDLGEIQQTLDPEITLIAYYIIEDHDALKAFVITRESFEFLELDASVEALHESVDDFYTIGMADLEHPNAAGLQELYEGLIEPVLPFVHTERVGLIPYQWMQYIPFAALGDGENHLGEQFALFVLPSASMVQFFGGNDLSGSSSALVLGDPATGNSDLSQLPYAAEEAIAVADQFETEAYLDESATEEILRNTIGSVNILHLAAHASLNTSEPLFSRIWLAPSGNEDGSLFVHEVYGLDLRSLDLVVLSACQTDRGELTDGDEIIGLNRAFLYEVPSVISSLWSVDDQATAYLMTTFYDYLSAGLAPAEALQAAQLAVRTNHDHPDWEHPYYWAGFVLNGDPGAGQTGGVQRLTSLAHAGWSSYFLIGCLVLLLTFGGLRLRNRRSSSRESDPIE